MDNLRPQKKVAKQPQHVKIFPTFAFGFAVQCFIRFGRRTIPFNRLLTVRCWFEVGGWKLFVGVPPSTHGVRVPPISKLSFARFAFRDTFVFRNGLFLLTVLSVLAVRIVGQSYMGYVFTCGPFPQSERLSDRVLYNRNLIFHQ